MSPQSKTQPDDLSSGYFYASLSRKEHLWLEQGSGPEKKLLGWQNSMYQMLFQWILSSQHVSLRRVKQAQGLVQQYSAFSTVPFRAGGGHEVES